MQKAAEQYETMNLVEKRLFLLLGLKLVDRKKIDEVCSRMDEIRKRITPKAEGFDGVAEIRKWREVR